MKELHKEEFLKKSMETLDEMIEMLSKQPVIELRELAPEKTGMIIVDMINGFAREGALKSERVEALIPEITELSKKCDILGIKKVVLADHHKNNSMEFGSYPPHCVEGTKECEIVEEILAVGGYDFIPKNSTNGFLDQGFMNWIRKNEGIDTYILTGDCTDICILQLATSLKAWYNQQEKASRIIVPINMVDTYDFQIHNGNLMNVFALYNMMINGIEVVKTVK